MRSRAIRFVSLAIWSLAVALVFGQIVLSYFMRGKDVSGGFGLAMNILLGIMLIGFLTVGVLATSRRPGNPVGWIITGAGISLVMSAFAESYGVYALFTAPGSLPGGEVMAWISAWVGIPSLFAAPALLFLLFPDGHLTGRRWLVVFWLVVVATCSAMVDAALNPVLDDAPFKGVASPLDIETPGTLLTPLSLIGWPGMAAGLLASAPAMISRLRHSRGIQRQQLKWIASAAAVLPLASLVGVISYYLGREGLGTIAALAAPLLIPLAAGYAVLRYRLYDIDVVINRTLVYGLLTVALALVYLGSVVSLQYVFRAVSGGESQLAIVASTLVIAALFTPLRRRIQTTIDRRFYRRKYDARQTLEAFAARLRNETDLQTLNGELMRVVRETMQPERVSLWLREPSAAKPEAEG